MFFAIFLLNCQLKCERRYFVGGFWISSMFSLLRHFLPPLRRTLGIYSRGLWPVSHCPLSFTPLIHNDKVCASRAENDARINSPERSQSSQSEPCYLIAKVQRFLYTTKFLQVFFLTFLLFFGVYISPRLGRLLTRYQNAGGGWGLPITNWLSRLYKNIIFMLLFLWNNPWKLVISFCHLSVFRKVSRRRDFGRGYSIPFELDCMQLLQVIILYI